MVVSPGRCNLLHHVTPKQGWPPHNAVVCLRRWSGRLVAGLRACLQAMQQQHVCEPTFEWCLSVEALTACMLIISCINFMQL